jgi:hypothetical protein
MRAARSNLQRITISAFTRVFDALWCRAAPGTRETYSAATCCSAKNGASVTRLPACAAIM